MPPTHQIRADYDQGTIVVYQAYPSEIALPAIQHHRFVPPFSLGRMTWIKPSFLWLMERSNWGRNSGQEHVLAVRITRQGWEEALSQAVLTLPEKGVYRNYEDWKEQFDCALVHVQWDPERSIRGAAQEYKSIQVGISRHIIAKYAEEWTVEIRDYTSLVRKLYGLINSGRAAQAKEMLPKEKVYTLPPDIARRIGMQ
jgi:hypothetical protein